MCGEFSEVAAIIGGLVFDFLVFGTPLLTFRDTLSLHNCNSSILKNVGSKSKDRLESSRIIRTENLSPQYVLET